MEFKKGLKAALSLALCFSAVLGSTSIDIKAAVGNVKVEKSGDKITIGNDLLEREFLIKGDSILTSAINNLRANKTLNPADGSEDFYINLLTEGNGGNTDADNVITNTPEYEYTGTSLDKSAWSGSITNAAGERMSDAEVAKAFDDNLDTYPNEHTVSGHPMTLALDLGSSQTIAAMSVNKRPGFDDADYGINGTMGGYKVYVSEDNENFTLAAEGEFSAEDYNLHQEGELYNVGDMVYVNFPEAKGRYVKVEQTSVAFGTAEEFASAEVTLYSDKVEKKLVVKEPTKALDRTNWNATVKNASGASFPAAAVKLLFDGNTNTHPDESETPGNPMTLDIDLGSKQTVSSLSIDKRPGYSNAAYGINGTMGEFELYVSDNGKEWKIAGAGNFTEEAYNLHQEGDLYNVGDRVYANFAKTYETRYVRLVQKSCSLGTTQEFTTSEVNLYEDQYKGYNWNTDIPAEVSETAIKSSALTYKDHKIDSITNGKKLTISYEPYSVAGVTYNINYVVVMENGKHYMRSFVEISASDKAKAQIDYIDTDRFVLTDKVEGIWSIPDESQISSMWIGKHELMLGQPIYAEGLFMGSEFPAAATDVVEDTTQIRYYSGKTFERLEKDGQLTKDGKFVSWQNVIGSAEDIDTAVVQTAFFEYIEEIATPTEFRKQYNSWYDNMMNITDDSIASSFNGAEAGLTSEGIEPLDSYVVDDGWNNYYDETFTAPDSSAGSGTPNQTGFWEFNNKFPNELYTSSALVDKFNSTFGVWVGPQGGYNYFSTFAQFLEASGTGYAQTNGFWTNVCVASEKYVNNLQTMFIDYQKRFNVDYWKWDGFAVRPCNNKNHDHMTGGYKDMYYTTDLWEKWLSLFDAVRASRAEEGKGLFINATCYVNLSPWLLQWVNTIWVQDSGDTGEQGTGERHEQKIYYRDQVYYQLFKQNEIQFPLKNIYNHDPIYGVSDNSNATTGVFREFLVANAVRGTAFWELYYSPSIMDDAKWKVTADIIEWAEDNHEILKNAKLFGNQPSEGVYGYSSWNGNEGIISFTNPLDSKETYTLTVDNIVGAPTSINNLTGVQVEPYAAGTLKDTLSYGDKLTVTLAPHETKVFQYGKTDTTAPKVVSAKVTGEKEVTVKFDERVDDTLAITVNGKASTAKLLDDYRTVVLTSEDTIMEEETKDVTLGFNVKDYYGNSMQTSSATISSFKDGVIASANKASDLKDAKNVENKKFEKSDIDFLKFEGEKEINDNDAVTGTTDFTVSMAVKTTSTDTTLFKQGNAIEVSIDKDGFVVFKVNDLSVSSKETVTTVVEKAHGLFGTDAYVPTSTTTSVIGNINDGDIHTVDAVREPNGMLKIYIDGKLSATTYDANKVNESVEAGKLTIGGNNFAGYLAAVKLTNSNTEFDVIEENFNSYGLNVTSIEVDRSNWTATACSQMSGTTGDAEAGAAIDGNEGSWWHTNYMGEDNHEMGEHWIQIDFNEETTFDNFVYTGRGGSNGDIKEFKLEALIGGEWKVIKTGEMTSAKTTVVPMDERITATAVKLTPLSTQNGENFAAAVEINVTVNADPIASMDEINGLKAQVETLDASKYTPDSYLAYMDVANKINNIDELNATKALVAELSAQLEAAKEGLVEVDPSDPVDKDALSNKVEEANGLDSNDFTAESWGAFEDALATAEKVLNDKDATQGDVNSALAQLNEAMEALVEVDPTVPTDPTDPEKPSTENADKDNTSGTDTGDTTNTGALFLLLLAAGATIGGVKYKNRKRV